MKRRILATLLGVVMLISAACGTKNPAETTAGSQETQTSAGTSGETEPINEEHPGWLTQEKKTLTVFTSEGVSATFPAASNDLPFWQFVEEYTNVHIEWEIASSAGYSEVVATRLAAAEDLADIMMVNTAGNAVSAGKNGVLVDLSQYWDTCFTNTKAYFEQEGTDYKTLVTAGDGGIYALLSPVNPVEGHIVFQYNTEWMKKLNAEVPKTLDEFTDLLYRMKEAGDLNGNGEDDEIILTSSSSATLDSALDTAFGLEQYNSWDAFVADENGVVSPEYTSDKMKEYLRYLSQLYADGILDKEMGGADNLSQKIAQDRVGVSCYFSSFAITYGSLTSAGQADPLGEYFTLGWPLASEYNDNTPYFMRREMVSSSPTAVTSGCEDIELACRWLDAVFCDPVLMRARSYGIEGEQWEYDENGEIQLIMPEDGSQWDVYHIGGGQIPICYVQTAADLLNDKQQYQWYLDEYDELREQVEWRSPTVPHLSLYTDEEQELLNEVKSNVSTYWSEAKTKFINGELSVETDWDTFLDTMKSLGIDTWTKVHQSVYDRTR